MIPAVVCWVLLGYAVPFLTWNPGAQQGAMGGAFVAVADDAYANLYNPAGLGFQRHPALALERNAVLWQADAYHGNVSIAVPVLRNSTLGAFYNRYRHYQTWPWYTLIDRTDGAAGVSFGHALLPHLSAGIGLKYVHSTDYYVGYVRPEPIRADSAGTLAWDAGLLFRYPAPVGTCGLGIALQTIPTGVKVRQGFESLPTNLRVGASYIVTLPELLTPDGKSLFRFGEDGFGQYLMSRWRVVLAYDLNLVFAEYHRFPWSEPVPEKPRHSLGVEVRPLPFFAVRFGYFEDMTIQDWYYSHRRGWTIGMGLDFRYFRLDIADDRAMAYEPHTQAPYRIRFTLSGSL